MRINLWLALALCLAPVPSRSAPDDFQGIKSRVTQFKLANGLQFLVLERHQAPVASFLTFADVGAVQESRGITGLAHIFEHMAFKGSRHIGTSNYADESRAMSKVDSVYAALAAEKRKGARADDATVKKLAAELKKAQDEADKFVTKNEFGEVIERAGGRGLNAMTAQDQTIYFFSLPSNEMELWFYLESERFLDPVFRQFYQERDVVMQERRLSESQPIGRLIEEFQAVAYKAHPYRDPVIGHMSDLENITREDAAAFFKKYYVPANLTCVVTGDVDPKRVRELAETYFSRIPASPQAEPLRTVEPPQTGERRVTLRLQAQRFFVAGYHKPEITHPDNAIYDALSSILSSGRSSRLYRSLVRDKKIAVQAAGGSGFPGQKYPGLFLFYALAAPGHTNAEIEKAFDEEIEKLKNEPVTKEELEGFKRRARASIIQSLDDNMNLGILLAFYQTRTGDWRNLFQQLDKVNAVTAGDIQRVAKAVFTRDNQTVAQIEPVEAGESK